MRSSRLGLVVLVIAGWMAGAISGRDAAWGIGPLCRYTIRDLGFMPLGGAGYRLVGPRDVLPEATVTGLADAGVELGWEAPAGSGWRLEAEGREPLPLGKDGEEAAQASLESSLRGRMTEEALASFAFVLRVEGQDPVANASAGNEVERARHGLERLAPQMPRPIEGPVVELLCTSDQRQAERVLLWSLGIPVQDGKSWLAVLYGRGQRAGAPWIVGSDDGLELLSQLALVGQSCECETERDWALEPQVPLGWGEAQRREAPTALGFDPESPWVRAEVVRILGKGGEGSLAASGETAIRRGSLEELLLGFRIEEVDGLDRKGVVPSVPAYRDPEAGERPFGLRRDSATQGDDWGFEEGPTLATTVGESGIPPRGPKGLPNPGDSVHAEPIEGSTGPEATEPGFASLRGSAYLGAVSLVLAILVLLFRGRA